MELDRFLAQSPLEWNYAVLDGFCWWEKKVTPLDIGGQDSYEIWLQ